MNNLGNIGMIMQAYKNPQQFLQNAMSNNQLMQNPIAKNAFEMYQHGDKQGLEELANNLCKEKGTTYEEMAKQIKSQFNI